LSVAGASFEKKVMRVKEVLPINFLFFRTETNVSALVNFLPVGQKLFKEAVRHNLQVSGPVHWHYHNFISLEQDFILEIALPIIKVPENYDGDFHVKRTETFRCVSEIHAGGWTQIPETYGRIFKFISEQNFSPANSNREIYINVDMMNDAGNETEIQIGIV
jgi:effector-binding domain-containing protein